MADATDWTYPTTYPTTAMQPATAALATPMSASGTHPSTNEASAPSR